MEPAIRIERTTCGLRSAVNPLTDNLTPQETTNQDAPDTGSEGGDLSCPGNSVVAENWQMRSLFDWRLLNGLRQRIVFPLLLINNGLTASFFGVSELNNDDQLLLSRSNIRDWEGRLRVTDITPLART